jgi:hypothetical protein
MLKFCFTRHFLNQQSLINILKSKNTEEILLLTLGDPQSLTLAASL